AMKSAITQTVDRRERQEAFNDEHGITPRTIQKALPVMGVEASELIAGTSGKGGSGGKRFVGGVTGQGSRNEKDIVKKFNLGSDGWESADDTISRVSQPSWAEIESILSSESDLESLDEADEELERLLRRLRKEMKISASRLEFEKAAQLRDRIFQLENNR
ncbi:MAG TPA: UvrB/UvrC motif-containing protein, partial [Candidatus Thalassarchaeaceae archaeon]|nr:UvrB/UvrC motif-containing protein [Candidatus Thalassarchaeaceae archaeon]